MTGQSARVLVIEDEPGIRKFLRATLTAHGHRVDEATTGRQGLLTASLQPPDCVLLDLGLPDMDGLQVTTELRAWTDAPIIVLSARGREADKVAALDAGADDYLTKPFSVAELLARMRATLRRRVQTGGEPVVTSGDLKVDFGRRVVTRAGKDLKLTPTEYTLLTSLARHAGKVLTHKQLLTEVWGPHHEHDIQYLRVFMAQLRHKIEDDPAQPRVLLTESGVGYRFSAPA